MKLNKIISYLMITVMLFCITGNLTLVSAASADITSETELLIALGITDGVEKVVTRGEFAEIVIKALNHPDNFLPPETMKFKDVPKNHSKYEYIELATALGLMNGYSDTMFSPDKEITVKEALKVLVDALGETRVKNGMDYYAAARDDGLLHKMTGAAGNPLTYDQMIILIYNFLHASVLSEYVLPDDGHKPGEGEAVLYVYFGICSLEGIYSANSYTAIDGEPTEEGYVRIGGKLMKVGSGINDDYLGCNVRCYYADEDLPTVIYACPARKNTDLVILPLDDVSDIGGALKCDLKKYNYNSKTVFIYNSEIVMSPQTLENAYSGVGYVKLVNSDGDSVYDYVFIEKYVVGTVESINLAMESFSLKGDVTSTTYSDYRAAVFEKTSGETVYADSLKRTDVVCVAYPKTLNGAIKVVECEDGGVATIESIDETNKTVYTNENIEYKAYFNDFSVLKLGQEYNLYFDELGILVYVKSGIIYRETGYIINAATQGNISNEILIKLINNSGQILLFEQDRKIKIRRPDGTFVNVRGQKVIDELEAVNVTYTNGTGESTEVIDPSLRQPIMYSLDSENLIREIWCLSNDISLEFHSLDSLMSTWSAEERSNLRLAAGAKTFGGVYIFGEDAFLYGVPSCEQEYDRDEEDELFYVKKVYGTLSNGSTYDTRSVRRFGDEATGTQMITAIANRANSLIADTIIIETGKPTSTQFGADNDIPILVTDIRYGIDAEGMDCIKVLGYGSDGKQVGFNYYDEDNSGLVAISNSKRKARETALTDVTYTPIVKGDIIKYASANEENTKNTVQLYYRNDLNNDGKSDPISDANICVLTSYYSKFRHYDSARLTTATIQEIDPSGSVMKAEVINVRNRDLDTDSITKHTEVMYLPGSVYFYNKAQKSLLTSTGQSLKVGDTILLIMSSAQSKYAVVYE